MSDRRALVAVKICRVTYEDRIVDVEVAVTVLMRHGCRTILERQDPNASVNDGRNSLTIDDNRPFVTLAYSKNINVVIWTGRNLLNFDSVNT